jgi:hypothetical protein
VQIAGPGIIPARVLGFLRPAERGRRNSSRFAPSPDFLLPVLPRAAALSFHLNEKYPMPQKPSFAMNRKAPLYFARFARTMLVVLALSKPAEDGAQAAEALAADTVRPNLAFTSPSGNERLSNATVMAAGKASDGRGVAGVWLRLNDGEWQLANGTTNWTAALQLTAGTNWLRAYAVDGTGNKSLTNSRSFFLVVKGLLTLQVFGDGIIMEVLRGGALTPYLDGQPRELGRSYAVRALAGPDSIFAGWSGDVESGQATLTFLMRTNLFLQGNFIPNPFIGLKGPTTDYSMKLMRCDTKVPALPLCCSQTREASRPNSSPEANATLSSDSSRSTAERPTWLHVLARTP